MDDPSSGILPLVTGFPPHLIFCLAHTRCLIPCLHSRRRARHGCANDHTLQLCLPPLSSSKLHPRKINQNELTIGKLIWYVFAVYCFAIWGTILLMKSWVDGFKSEDKYHPNLPLICQKWTAQTYQCFRQLQVICYANQGIRRLGHGGAEISIWKNRPAFFPRRISNNYWA